MLGLTGIELADMSLVGGVWKRGHGIIQYVSLSGVCKMAVWRVGRGREPWERSEAGGVIGNERHLHHSPVSSPTEELRKG